MISQSDDLRCIASVRPLLYENEAPPMTTRKMQHECVLLYFHCFDSNVKRFACSFLGGFGHSKVNSKTIV